jgi:hypothetical protein
MLAGKQVQFQVELPIESKLIIVVEIHTGDGASETDSEGIQKRRWLRFVLCEKYSRRESGLLRGTFGSSFLRSPTIGNV